MIKVIVGYKVKQGAEIQPILSKFMSQKTQYPGFIGTEILRSIKQSSLILEISSWDNDAAWMEWEKSTIRQELLRHTEELLVDQPIVSIWRILPTKR
jgi:antibiotic biosynthesis monooxygenase (ABM) superfamily enzyme